MIIKETIGLMRNELVYGGQLISIGAISVVFTAAILLGIKITWDCLIIIYLGIHSAYLYNRYKELKVDFLTNPKRTQYLKKNIRHIPLIIFFYTFLLIVGLMYSGRTQVIIFGTVLFLFGLSYSVFFKELTKKIIGFKDFFVALSWASLIIFLAVYYSFPLNLSIILVLIFVCLRCFIGTSFYDVKDIESDKREKLLSLAVVFGKKKLFRFLNLINILTFLPIIFGIYLGLFPMFSLILFFTIPITSYFLKKLESEKENIAYLSEIAIGMEKISWSVLILLGNFLL